MLSVARFKKWETIWIDWRVVVRVAVASLCGLTPIAALFYFAANAEGMPTEALQDPKVLYSVIAGSVLNAIIIAIGNIGDLLGYYAPMRIIPKWVERNFPGNRLLKTSVTVLGGYGINGAFWALVNAVALGLLAVLPETEANLKVFTLVNGVTTNFGWAVIGNTLGSVGWVMMGVALLRGKKYVFGILTLLLGIGYFLGGRIAVQLLGVPDTLADIGLYFYLFFGLVWNVLATLFAKKLQTKKV